MSITPDQKAWIELMGLINVQNAKIKEHSEWLIEDQEIVDDHAEHIDTLNSDVNRIADLLLESSQLQARLITVLETHNDRLSALEDLAGEFYQNSVRSRQIEDLKPDTEVAEYNESDEVGHSSGPHIQVQAHPIDVFGVITWDSSYTDAEIARFYLQRLFERR